MEIGEVIQPTHRLDEDPAADSAAVEVAEDPAALANGEKPIDQRCDPLEFGFVFHDLRDGPGSGIPG